MATLDDVKVGDKVIYSNGWGDDIVTVTKVTKTQIHTGYSRYRKSDGRMVNADTWSRAKIRPYDEETVKKIERRNKQDKMVTTLRNYPYHDLSFEDLETVYNILMKAKK